MADSDLPLYRAFPALKHALPRVPFVCSPTPVESLALYGVPDGMLFVKRDDRCCPLYGGNKPRKLEFLLGHALACGSRTLVTTGGLGTNHGLAMTILGRSVGIGSVLVLVDQPVTASVRETLRLQFAYGAQQIAAGNVAGAAVQTLRALVTSTLRGERPQLVPTGGSSALGDVGFVSAGFELAEQVRAGDCPEPKTIYLPVGSGGSVVGLTLGLRLAGLQSRVLGVLVNDILPPSSASLARAARSTLRLLRRADPSLPQCEIGAGDFPIARDQLGPGYGAATEAAIEALAAAKSRGLHLDTTYSAKTLAAIRERAARRELGAGPVLFWDTYNSVDVAAAAPRAASEADLPASVRRALARASR